MQQTARTSVVVCTRDRHELFRRALGSVLEQSDVAIEVIVVDGSAEPVTVPDDRRIRLVRQSPKGAGAARAAALEIAAGEYLAFCDDDDTWLPDHLAVLHRALESEGPAVVAVYGDSSVEFDGHVQPLGWSVPFDGRLLQTDNYIFCSDVLARSEAVRAVGGFDSALARHEDWDLWLRLSLHGKLRHVPARLGTRSWSDESNAAPGGPATYDAVRERHQIRLSRAGTAAEHDIDLRDALVRPFDPATWTPRGRELLWTSVLHAHEGYGSVGRQLLLALEEQGVSVFHTATRNQPPPGFERFFRSPEHWGRVSFYYDYLCRPDVLPVGPRVGYTMWESTGVPPEHVASINEHIALQYVPCQQNLEAYAEAGVTVPMRVLHHGVDARWFPLLDRRSRDFFVFGTFGDLQLRKGTDVLIQAFCDEFTAIEPVRLICKTTRSMAPPTRPHPGLEIRQGVLDHGGVLALLSEMDAFVLPSRGEGFGLCGLEAMATGLPLIATNWGGPVEYLDPRDSYPLAYELVAAKGAVSGGVRYEGMWAEPSYEHLRALMREVFSAQDVARDRGLQASARVHDRWTWQRVAEQVVKDIDVLVGA